MAATGEVRIRRGGSGDARALAALRWAWAGERGPAQPGAAFDGFDGFGGEGATLRLTLLVPA